MIQRMMVAVVCTLLLAGCASTGGPGASVLRTTELVVARTPRFELPILQKIGFTLNGQKIITDNGTPWYGRAVIYGSATEPGSFEPGDELVAARYYSPHYTQIPVVVTFYRDPGLTQCVGGVGGVFSFSPGQAASIPWDIQGSNVTTLEGFSSPTFIGGNYPLPLTNRVTRGVEIPGPTPGFTQGGTLAIQVTNLMHFTLGVNVEGRGDVLIPPCGTYYTAFIGLFGESRSVSVKLTASQLLPSAPGQVALTPSLMLGKNSSSCQVPSDGVAACQILVAPQFIRR